MYFLKKGCEIVLLEVSMGGRMDTTNVILDPLVSIITPISYDHMTILGNTLTEIATEKAGIIKSGTTVVSAVQEDEVIKVLEDTCAKQSVSIEFVKSGRVMGRDIHGQSFTTSDGEEYFTKMLGTYQIDNAAVAITAARKLGGKGYPITEEAIRRGIANTKWFGRFTLLSDNPPVIIDGGHNRQGATVLRQSLEEYFPGKKITFVLGILADKEVDIIPAWADQILSNMEAGTLPETTRMYQLDDMPLTGSDVSLGITSIGSNPDGAHEFIAFVISPEGQKICLENMKAIPVISPDLIDSDQKELVASLGNYSFISNGNLWKEEIYPLWQETILPL